MQRTTQHLSESAELNAFALHQIAATTTSLEDFLNKIESIQSELPLLEMAVTLDHENQLAIDRLRQNQIIRSKTKEADYEIIKIYLLNLAVKKSAELPPIGKLIDSAEIEKEYQHLKESNTKLFNNLIIACELINYARSQVQQSITHPQINFEETDEKYKARDAILSERKLVDTQSYTWLSRNFFSDLTVEEIKRKLTKLTADSTKSTKLANCYEYAILAEDYAGEHYPELPVKRMKSNLHHAYLKIGEGDNQVYCDPYAGRPFPNTPEEREKYLKGYRCFNFGSVKGSNTFFNVITKQNNSGYIEEEDKWFSDIISNVSVLDWLSHVSSDFFAALTANRYTQDKNSAELAPQRPQIQYV